MANLPTPIRGIIPPMVTPLSDPDRLDRDGLERLIEHILDGGVHGLFILGTTGEGPSLSYCLRKELMAAVCGQVGDRVPVLVGITDTSFSESVTQAHQAADRGAAALVVAPPPYFATSQDELLGYLDRLASAAPLPIFLYNMPVHTKVSIDARTVLTASKIPGIAGLKDSSGSMSYLHLVRELLGDRIDFSLLVGPEELLAETILLGGHGGVNGGANLAPQLYVALYEAARSGNLARTQQLHQKVIRLSSLLYTVGKTGASMLRGLKCALSLMGICDDTMAEPFVRFGPVDRSEVAARLDRIDTTVQPNTR